MKTIAKSQQAQPNQMKRNYQPFLLIGLITLIFVYFVKANLNIDAFEFPSHQTTEISGIVSFDMLNTIGVKLIASKPDFNLVTDRKSLTDLEEVLSLKFHAQNIEELSTLGMIIFVVEADKFELVKHEALKFGYDIELDSEVTIDSDNEI